MHLGGHGAPRRDLADLVEFLHRHRRRLAAGLLWGRFLGACQHLRHRSSPPFNAAPLLEARGSEEHTSELQSLMRISYAVFCLKKKKNTKHTYAKCSKLQSSIPRLIYSLNT